MIAFDAWLLYMYWNPIVLIASHQSRSIRRCRLRPNDPGCQSPPYPDDHHLLLSSCCRLWCIHLSPLWKSICLSNVFRFQCLRAKKSTSALQCHTSLHLWWRCTYKWQSFDRVILVHACSTCVCYYLCIILSFWRMHVYNSEGSIQTPFSDRFVQLRIHNTGFLLDLSFDAFSLECSTCICYMWYTYDSSSWWLETPFTPRSAYKEARRG